MASKLPQVILRFPKREIAMLDAAAKAYRSPSRNWFVREMIMCMLNPARWPEFTLRMSSGQQQLTLELEAKAARRTKRKGSK